MTETALKILDNDPDGFFAFIEHEGIDEYSHANNAEGLVKAMSEFNAAVQKAIDWVNTPGDNADWNNTLIVIVGDHETGGLTVTETTPMPGEIPAATWTTTGHTQTPVAVYAQGSGAAQITGAQIDNTNIFTLLSPVVAPPAAPSNLLATAISSSQINLAWSDNSVNETGFKIERSPNGSTSWMPIATVGANLTSYSNTGLSTNTTYYYQVRATNAGGDSAYSNVASATTLAPSSIHVSDLDGSRVMAKKNWSATVTITVHDGSHNTVSGVTVSGSWSAGATGSASCTTNTSGVCSVTKSNLKLAVSSVTFTISNLVKSGAAYTSTANHDVDGGSDGTTINVVK
jgi:hypothetical protein